VPPYPTLLHIGFVCHRLCYFSSGLLVPTAMLRLKYVQTALFRALPLHPANSAAGCDDEACSNHVETLV
jgi:hypothetical protein